MQKYLYKAHAVALEGSIRKPYFQELGSHLAISTYAGSGGISDCSSQDFVLGNEVTYKTAHTRIEAVMVNGLYQTTVTAQVKGLRIGKAVACDEVTCILRSVYDPKEYPRRCVPRISPAGSAIKGLYFAGKLRDGELRLPPAFHSTATTPTDAFFTGARDQDLEASPPVKQPPHIYDPQFGTLYYAEWTWVHPQEHHQQRLTMLRLALGCDLGADIDVGVCSSDGVGWPPVD
jgi:hypothetical protein